jgi:3-phenylpropionate/trans-cinnamate dioxygenase ferredoxin component
LSDWLPAVKVSDVSEGTMVTADVNGNHVLITNIGGTFYAVSGTCTHEETDLALGFMIEDRVVCPLHLSQFELKSGAAVNPPATVPLKRFNTKVLGDTIFIEV